MKNLDIKIFPIEQTGENCKTIAITALEQYYASQHNYPPIPLHKRYDGSHLLVCKTIY